MKMRVQLTAFVLFVTAAAVALLAGQPPAPQPQSPQSQAPTFRLRVDYVEVDVVVTDRDGNLVNDLKQSDFQVSEDGKAHTLRTFPPVNIPIGRFGRPLNSSVPFEPGIKTNETPFDGRVYVMVIDDLHTNFGRSARVKIAAPQFLGRRLRAHE